MTHGHAVVRPVFEEYLFMPMHRLGGAMCVVLAMASWSARARANETCPSPLGLADVIRCAVDTSPEVLQARQALQAVAARRLSAGAWLPGFPVASISGAYRRSSQEQDWNAYFTLSQEIEIGGQRTARLDEVDAEVAAQVRRIAAVENEVAAGAARAYYLLVGVQQEVTLANDLRVVADSMSAFAQGRLQQQLLSEVDAHLLLADAARLQQLRIDSQRRMQLARVTLQTALNQPLTESIVVSGDLAPARVDSSDDAALSNRALQVRGDVAAAEAERQVFELRERRLEVERKPNLTAFALLQRDGFAEYVAGAGISMALPFTGRAYAPNNYGAIAETQALQEQAKTGTQIVRRQVRAEVERALIEYRARAEALATFPPALIEAARKDIQAIRTRLSLGELPVREVLLAERSLIELLQSHLEARLSYALASVELTRAAALSWPGARP